MARGKKRGVAKRGKAKKSKVTAKKIAKQAKPIELYYWPTPNGFKISIMLEECGLPYVLKPVNISKGEQFNPDFLKIAPNNRMPAIVDPQGPGGRPVPIFESGAILQYLGRKTGKFYPSDERARVEVDQWLFWQMGGLGPMAGQLHEFDPPDRFVAGTVGQPGERTFFLQVSGNGRVVTVALEKQQVAVLAERIRSEERV